MCGALTLVLAAGALPVWGQQSSPGQSRFIPVTVTDSRNRLVAGLQQEHFEILEKGVTRPITDFVTHSPLALAVVTDTTLSQVSDFMGPRDELIQTPSLSDALRRLAASENSRKVLVLTTAVEIDVVPTGVQVVQADSARVHMVAIQLRNQYLLHFQPSDPAAPVEVVLRQPRGLQGLKAEWKGVY
jgi:hypothetical protein